MISERHKNSFNIGSEEDSTIINWNTKGPLSNGAGRTEGSKVSNSAVKIKGCWSATPSAGKGASDQWRHFNGSKNCLPNEATFPGESPRLGRLNT